MSAKVTTELAKGPRNLHERLWKGKNQRSPWKPNCKRRVDVVIGLAKSPWESSPYDVWHLSPLNNESSGVLKLRSLPRSPGSRRSMPSLLRVWSFRTSPWIDSCVGWSSLRKNPLRTSTGWGYELPSGNQTLCGGNPPLSSMIFPFKFQFMIVYRR